MAEEALGVEATEPGKISEGWRPVEINAIPRRYADDHCVRYASIIYETGGTYEEKLFFGQVVSDLVNQDELHLEIKATIYLPLQTLREFYEMLHARFSREEKAKHV